MSNFINSSFSLLTIILAGFIGAYFQSHFQHRKEVEEDIHKLKRARYGAILIQMLTMLEPVRGLQKIKEFRPDLTSVDEVKKEFSDELLHGFLFADDEVLMAMVDFYNSPSYILYIKIVSAMRRDLWNKKTKIGEDLIKDLQEKKD